jgi:hypothetical protein
MTGRVAWTVALALAALVFAAGPWLVPGFDGYRPSAFPVPQIGPPVQPVGIAFAIWGIIYAWLLVSAVFGLIWRTDAVDWYPMRPPLTVSLLIGAAWLPVAELAPVTATILIWLMLGSALLALIRAPRADRWYARGPVALYAGWLTAASAVGSGLVLAGYGVTGEVPAAWAMLALAFVIGMAVLLAVPDCAEYGAGLGWALLGVGAANLGGETALAWAAFAGAALVLLAAARSVREALG